MALDSPKSTTSVVPNEMGQLGLSQRITKLRKTSLTAQKRSWLVNDDTESIIRASQIVRAQLVRAVSSSRVSNAVVVADTDQDKKKAIEINQAKLLCASAFAPKYNNEVVVVGGTWKSPTSLALAVRHCLTDSTPQPCKPRRFAYPVLSSHYNSGSDVDTGIGNGISLSPSPLSVCFPHENETNDSSSKYDGQMHSYPYKKNGPYTCPKCERVFETSQRFAAHVSSSHYKYESKSERKKRLMAKIRRRNLRIEWSTDGGLTVVPDDDDDDSSPPPTTTFSYARNNNNVVRGVKVEGETHGVALQLAPPPGWEKLTAGDGVKIKLEPVNT